MEMERGRGTKRGRGKIAFGRIRWKSHEAQVQKLNLDDDWLPILVTSM